MELSVAVAEAGHYDVIVLGLGGVGSAALYWTARHAQEQQQRDPTAKALRVLGLEQFELGHHRGSSQDHSRIIRLAYDHAHYTRLAPHMYMAWRSVEDECGVTLLLNTGILVFGASSNRVIADYADAMSAQGIPFEDMTGEAAMKRWPQLNLNTGPEGDRVLYQSDAGIVDPRKANAAHIALARARGAYTLDNTRVESVLPMGTGGSYRITTESKGVFTCDKLIVAAGAWTNHCLKGLGSHVPMTVTKEQVTYYETRHLRKFAPSNFPVWIAYDGNHEDYYGFPVYGEMGTKAGMHGGGKEVDPDKRDFDADLHARDKLNAFLKRKIPDFLGPIMYTKTCLYATPPDDDLVLDLLPHHPNVAITIGAGHGYKWASFFGLVLSELALKGSTCYPISAMSIKRPALGATFDGSKTGPHKATL
eukprot:TRINITY_DN2861_c0_g1_i3.p1 TRINITY_DN2861_c0_g1~~TRINITY_DN2861_c0_g1_i3.p1  ORF type:complete len:420 (-),score=68.55 TRINITY_DN2861_c0_g1_i3:112-1371(-)